ncbi:endonuclease domain-containing protein [Nostoc sp. 'Peltigera malacea cyanobiont' DB3992]|uniref:endonuclease domain-containing protein n=1 Tax=Nostoc sp. 'Peltigera malacea cyanobiont' DB3992 TaxID=1206980 RepID=UPI00211E0E1B|nr:endonuclease domain-containing protein [Nostoc sp. 'Peltigera malacea cyanobiont' DB3992]
MANDPKSKPQASHRLQSPSSLAGRGLGGGVPGYPWQTPHELWKKLKPLARQMRCETTPAEKLLWEKLRHKQLLGFKFRRQQTIDRFIVDFYCNEARLVVEVDGEIHDYTQQEDAIRQEFLESLGLQVVRFRNEDILEKMEGVLQDIGAWLQR